ncbi:MAG: phosphotransacetylase family protein [Candidatus Bathyarchaeota archaeon]|jgi:BioD-like phosphotransacetylase family protein|nr:phosphotransacetylase family protein [Candidatus Bathyarchaeota archaeon]
MNKIPSIYVCSIESFCGKSSFCLGFALTLQEQGYNVGYFKPVGWEMTRDINGNKIDEDAQLMNHVLNLQLPQETITPIILGSRYLEESNRINPQQNREQVLQAYYQAASDKDIMIIEGPYSMGVGTSIGIEAPDIINQFQSHVVMIAKAHNDAMIDRIICQKTCLEAKGMPFMGAILNFIQKTSIERVKGFGVPILEKYGVNVLGIIPDDISLRAPTVGEICNNISCTILTCNDKMDTLVEDVLVGAMTPESALSYFRRSLRKAVITGGDRSDIQLAALQTDTSVLILTGNFYPDVRVLARAEELGVPVLLVPYDTFTTIKEIASLSGRIKATNTHKIQIAKDLVQKHVNWKDILQRAEVS